jgi:Uma2 family endonuclease
MPQEKSADALAPWAEPVPGREHEHLTADELLALPDDDKGRWRYELVEGRLVRMPGPGGEHGEITAILSWAVVSFVKAHRLGRVLAAETGFELGPDTVRGADVAFVRADRLPARDSAEWKKYWQLAPDLVAEVASPSQGHDAMDAKARAWLVAGVRLVWVVWPARREVDVWRPTDTSRPTITLTLSDALDGMDVLPGFTFPVADLFA